MTARDGDQGGGPRAEKRAVLQMEYGSGRGRAGNPGRHSRISEGVRREFSTTAKLRDGEGEGGVEGRRPHIWLMLVFSLNTKIYHGCCMCWNLNKLHLLSTNAALLPNYQLAITEF